MEDVYDGYGLYVEIAPSGGKWFRQKYRFFGKEKRISLGVYPSVTFRQARGRRDAARELIAKGIDPSHDRKERRLNESNRAASTFEAVTREWLAKQGSVYETAHLVRVTRRFENDIFPFLGNRPIAYVTAPELLGVLRRVEARGARETAKRALVGCGQVFRYAIATGRAERDLSKDFRGAFSPVQTERFAATTAPEKLAGILRATDSYDGTIVVRCALRLMPLVFVQPGELRSALWKEIDLDGAEWRFTVSMTDTPHIVPLSYQALSILGELYPVTGGHCGFAVFPHRVRVLID